MRLMKIEDAAVQRAQDVINAGQPWNATVKELQQWLTRKTGESWNGVTKQGCLDAIQKILLS